MSRPIAVPAPPPSRKLHRKRRRTGLFVLAAATATLALLLVLPPPGVTATTGAAPGESSSNNVAAFGGTANSANARFVVDAYQQLLGRTADSAGLDFHLSRLAAGGDRSRQTFVYALLFSSEGSGQEVGRAYDDLLGRAADATGATYWTSHLEGHGVLDLRVLLLASEEYHSRAGGTNAAWIEALYLDVLGRASDPGGLAYWLALADGGTPRPLIVAGLYLSDEALERRVDAYYQETLTRAPTPTERTDGVAYIRTNGERQLRAEIWASDEAFEQYLDAALS
ncbi:MAG: DUF4214 domain-containing protein, partial [Actinomycetota bacterium]